MLDEEEEADEAGIVDEDADEMSEHADEGTVKDESDVGGKRNGMLAASFPCMAALSSGYNPVARNPAMR